MKGSREATPLNLVSGPGNCTHEESTQDFEYSFLEYVGVPLNAIKYHQIMVPSYDAEHTLEPVACCRQVTSGMSDHAFSAAPTAF